MLSLNSGNILHYQEYHFSLNIKKKKIPRKLAGTQAGRLGNLTFSVCRKGGGKSLK